MVMPSNRIRIARDLEREHPGRMGLLFPPDSFRLKKVDLPYALDNGRFSVWARGNKWDRDKFEELLCWAEGLDREPLWVVVPDKVGDAEGTLRSWDKWSAYLRRYGWPLAMAVQDGMVPKDVMGVRPLPDVVFVGGTTRWKWRSLPTRTKSFPRVHVGRVNTYGPLWTAHRAGAESTDGTGWWHDIQHEQLVKYLDRSGRGVGETNGRGILY